MTVRQFQNLQFLVIVGIVIHLCKTWIETVSDWHLFISSHSRYSILLKLLDFSRHGSILRESCDCLWSFDRICDIAGDASSPPSSDWRYNYGLFRTSQPFTATQPPKGGLGPVHVLAPKDLNLSDPFLAVPKLLLSWLFPWENQWTMVTMARIFGAPWSAKTPQKAPERDCNQEASLSADPLRLMQCRFKIKHHRLLEKYPWRMMKVGFIGP